MLLLIIFSLPHQQQLGKSVEPLVLSKKQEKKSPKLETAATISCWEKSPVQLKKIKQKKKENNNTPSTTKTVNCKLQMSHNLKSKQNTKLLTNKQKCFQLHSKGIHRSLSLRKKESSHTTQSKDLKMQILMAYLHLNRILFGHLGFLKHDGFCHLCKSQPTWSHKDHEPSAVNKSSMTP